MILNKMQVGEIDFKVEGPWNTEKYCRLPWLANKKKFWIADALEWLKQFWPWWQPFNSYSFETLSFLPLFLFFLFVMQKRGWGGGMLPPRPSQYRRL